jgi:hypothetical protein
MTEEQNAALADGSGWQRVYELLTGDRSDPRVEPTSPGSLDPDVQIPSSAAGTRPAPRKA